MQIPDAPWIRETERTGYCSSGWWNTPPRYDEDEEFEEDEFEEDLEDELSDEEESEEEREGNVA